MKARIAASIEFSKQRGEDFGDDHRLVVRSVPLDGADRKEEEMSASDEREYGSDELAANQDELAASTDDVEGHGLLDRPPSDRPPADHAPEEGDDFEAHTMSEAPPSD
jgi:hypothetical protein